MASDLRPRSADNHERQSALLRSVASPSDTPSSPYRCCNTVITAVVRGTMTEEAKEETTAVASDETIKAVAERLRFFFSDANVRADTFLRKEILKAEEGKGHVAIETLLRFNSIKQHTSDPAVVVAAAQTLPDNLVVGDDEKSIARVTPFTLKMMDDNIPLSLYITNLPITEDNKYPPDTMKKVRTLFEPYGEVALVKLRFKRAEGGEKGSVAIGGAFVEFSSKDGLEKAAEEVLTTKDGETVEPKKKLTVGDNTLEVVTMKEWLESKKKKKNVTPDSSKKRDRDEPVAFEELKIDWKPGCVVRLKGLNTEACDREAIRDAVCKAMGITEQGSKDLGIYADYSRGQTEGAIRFNEPGESIAELTAKLSSGDVEIAGAKVESASILEGDEESKYWADFIAFKNKQLKHRAEEKASKKRSRR